MSLILKKLKALEALEKEKESGQMAFDSVNPRLNTILSPSIWLSQRYRLGYTIGVIVVIGASGFYFGNDLHHIFNREMKTFYHTPAIKPLPIYPMSAKTNLIENRTASPVSLKSTDSIKKPSPLDIDDQTTALFNQAADFSSLGNINQAIQKLQQAVMLKPEYQEARKSLIALLIEQGEYDVASDVIDRGLNLTPNFTPFIQSKGYIFIEQKRYQDAVDWLSQYPIDIHQDPSYYSLIAIAYNKLGDHINAAKVYKMLTKVEPTNGSWWFGLGISLQQAQDTSAAMEAFQKASTMQGLTPDEKDYLMTKVQTQS